MKKLLIRLMAAVLSISLLTACGSSVGEFDQSQDFSSILEKAKGQTVSFYGWGGNEANNRWIDTVLTPKVKEKYNITLKRMPMDIEQVMSKLSGEK